MSDTEGQDEDRNEIMLSNDDDSDSGPPSPKRPNLAKEAKKYGGAKKYKTKFKAVWEKKWPCIVPVKDNVHMFYYTVCFKQSPCSHQGETDVKCHIESAQHKKNCGATHHVSPLSFPSSSTEKVKH